MKSLLILTAAGALMATNALADDGATFLNGDWIGTGSFQMGGEIMACSEVKMRFSGSKTEYVVREASMICGTGPKQEFTEIDAFSIREDGQIYFETGTNTKLAKNTKVGVVKDDKLRTVNPIEADNVDDISMQRAGDFVIYSQVAGVPGKTPDYSLMAILKKDPSAAAIKP
jgi:hypothetical protein